MLAAGLWGAPDPTAPYLLYLGLQDKAMQTILQKRAVWSFRRRNYWFFTTLLRDHFSPIRRIAIKNILRQDADCITVPCMVTCSGQTVSSLGSFNWEGRKQKPGESFNEMSRHRFCFVLKNRILNKIMGYDIYHLATLKKPNYCFRIHK